MATFEKRGKFWRVKVRRGAAPAQTRTFDSKSLAQQIARTVEGEIDNRVLVYRRAAGANLVCAGPEALPLRGDTH